jgi:hypothetical protein
MDDDTHKAVESFGLLGWYCLQLIDLGQGREPRLDLSVAQALTEYQEREARCLQAWSRPDQAARI